MISLVINLDTRPGLYADSFTWGDDGKPTMNGVRSVDFLLEGVEQKVEFFRGNELELVLFIDEVEPIGGLLDEVKEMANALAPENKVVCKRTDHTRHRWNDYNYLEALSLATGDYVAHFDADSNAYREDESPVIEDYFELLEEYSYVCYPTIEEYNDWHASTRFFICERETLDLEEAERCMDPQYLVSHYGWKGEAHFPCMEHILGAMEGGNVHYPRPTDDYAIFSWARYHRGTIARLNEMPFRDVAKYLEDCGGAHLGAGDIYGIEL